MHLKHPCEHLELGAAYVRGSGRGLGVVFIAAVKGIRLFHIELGTRCSLSIEAGPWRYP